MMLRRRLMDLLTGVYHVRLLWNRGTGRHAHVRSRRAVNDASTWWWRRWWLLLMRLLLLLVLVLLCNNGLNHSIEPFMSLLNLAKHETKIIQIYNKPWIGGSQKIALLLNSHDLQTSLDSGVSSTEELRTITASRLTQTSFLPFANRYSIGSLFSKSAVVRCSCSTTLL